MAKVLVLGDKYTIYTFRLLGFEGMIVEKGEELLKLLDELREREDLGVILVTSDIVNQVRDAFNRIRLKTTKPLIMEIPSLREVKFEAVDYLGILRAALGI